jgi:3-dehydroquinate synthase
MAAGLSRRLGWIDAASEARIRGVISGFGLPVQPPPSIATERWLELMAVDKKVQAGTLRLVLLRAIGEAVVSADFSTEDLIATIAP